MHNNDLNTSDTDNAHAIDVCIPHVSLNTNFQVLKIQHLIQAYSFHSPSARQGGHTQVLAYVAKTKVDSSLHEFENH